MKNPIRLTALFLILATSAFAKTPRPVALQNMVSIQGLTNNPGITVTVAEALTISPVVIISDQSANIIYKGNLSGIAGSSKTYNLSLLEDGDYTVSISWNHQEIKKQVHIFAEEIRKTSVLN